MKSRILYAYIGAIITTSYLLLLYYLNVEGIIIFILFFAPSLPFGILVGLVYSDKNRKLSYDCIKTRIAVSAILYTIFCMSLMLIDRYLLYSYYRAVNLMFLSLVFAPLWCALPSYFVCRNPGDKISK